MKIVQFPLPKHNATYSFVFIYTPLPRIPLSDKRAKRSFFARCNVHQLVGRVHFPFQEKTGFFTGGCD